MAAKMKYMVVQAVSAKALAEEVQEHCKKGWKPQGGVAVVDDQRSAYAVYSQSMVKK